MSMLTYQFINVVSYVTSLFSPITYMTHSPITYMTHSPITYIAHSPINSHETKSKNHFRNIPAALTHQTTLLMSLVSILLLFCQPVSMMNPVQAEGGAKKVPRGNKAEQGNKSNRQGRRSSNPTTSKTKGSHSQPLQKAISKSLSSLKEEQQKLTTAKEKFKSLHKQYKGRRRLLSRVDFEGQRGLTFTRSLERLPSQSSSHGQIHSHSQAQGSIGPIAKPTTKVLDVNRRQGLQRQKSLIVGDLPAQVSRGESTDTGASGHSEAGAGTSSHAGTEPGGSTQTGTGTWKRARVLNVLRRFSGFQGPSPSTTAQLQVPKLWQKPAQPPTNIPKQYKAKKPTVGQLQQMGFGEKSGQAWVSYLGKNGGNRYAPRKYMRENLVDVRQGYQETTVDAQQFEKRNTKVKQQKLKQQREQLRKQLTKTKEGKQRWKQLEKERLEKEKEKKQKEKEKEKLLKMTRQEKILRFEQKLREQVQKLESIPKPQGFQLKSYDEDQLNAQLRQKARKMKGAEQVGSGSQSVALSDSKSDSKSDTKSDSKPTTKSDSKSDTKSDTKSATKSDSKPKTPTSPKPSPKSSLQSEPNK